MLRYPGLMLCCALAALPGCIEDSSSPADESAQADATAAPPADGGGGNGGAMADAARPLPPDVGPDAAPPPGPDVTPPCGNEDDLAPNQNIGDASPVDTAFLRQDLFLCPASDDWLILPLQAGQSVTVQLLADPPEANLDVAITDADGNALATGEAPTGQETFDFQAPSAGTYYVHVYATGDDAAFYALSIQSACSMDAACGEGQVCDRFQSACAPFEGPAACGDDMFEPNDRDADASGIAAPTGVDATICGADRDWYAFAAGDGDSFDLLLSFPEGEDLDVFIVEAGTGRTVASATADARFNPERLGLSFLPAGRYLIGVFLYAPDGGARASVDYHLELAGRSGQCEINRDCLNDGLPICADGICHPVEEDRTVPPGGACGSDRNCSAAAEFCFTGGPGGHDNFCTDTCGDDADCDALGNGSTCQPIDRRTAICVPACRGDDDCSTFRTCEGGTCELRGECRVDNDCGDGEVCRNTDFGAYCSLPPPPPQCGVDMGFEPNEGAGTATPMMQDEAGAAHFEGLHICDGDDDWFALTVAADKAAWLLTVSVGFRAGVDIDVYLYDAAGNLVGAATSPDQTEEVIEARFIAPGEYMLRVDQFSSDALTDTEYGVNVEMVDNDDGCTADGNECGATDPLRASCDAETGACQALDGAGEVPLGGRCDSDDDCTGEAEACWVFEGGAQGWNICTISCRAEEDCAAIEGTVCTDFQQFAVCLPPR